MHSKTTERNGLEKGVLRQMAYMMLEEKGEHLILQNVLADMLLNYHVCFRSTEPGRDDFPVSSRYVLSCLPHLRIWGFEISVMTAVYLPGAYFIMQELCGRLP